MKSVSVNEGMFQAAEIELIYRPTVKASERPQIRSSKDAYKILLQNWDDNKIGFIEQFKVILLNPALKVLGIHLVSTGGLNGTVVDIRLVFAAALKACACSIILAHNHPSGELQPSDLDRAFTQKIKEGGFLMDILLKDHLIISKESYLSFADDGLL